MSPDPIIWKPSRTRPCACIRASTKLFGSATVTESCRNRSSRRMSSDPSSRSGRKSWMTAAVLVSAAVVSTSNTLSVMVPVKFTAAVSMRTSTRAESIATMSCEMLALRYVEGMVSIPHDGPHVERIAPRRQRQGRLIAEDRERAHRRVERDRVERHLLDGQALFRAERRARGAPIEVLAARRRHDDGTRHSGQEQDAIHGRNLLAGLVDVYARQAAGGGP